MTFELLLHAAFVADEIYGFVLERARTKKYSKSDQLTQRKQTAHLTGGRSEHTAEAVEGRVRRGEQREARRTNGTLYGDSHIELLIGYSWPKPCANMTSRLLRHVHCQHFVHVSTRRTRDRSGAISPTNVWLRTCCSRLFIPCTWDSFGLHGLSGIDVYAEFFDT